MIDLISRFILDGMSVRQRDFIKSLAVTAPMGYVSLFMRMDGFAGMDLFSRCMFSLCLSLILLFFSVFSLWLLSRLERRMMRDGMFYYITPAVIAFVFQWDYATVDVARVVFYSYVCFFAPFWLYGVFMKIAHGFDKPDVDNTGAEESAKDYSGKQAEDERR